jgi:hypothetical protein
MSLACRYTFRLLIGAGQSKIGARSSACWLELTCTQTHYFTQPMPNAFAWLFHRLPPWVHRLEVALTFAEQLGLPFLVLMPSRTLQTGACLAELVLQLGIVGTGNYAWINFVGAVPALALLDDRFLSRLLPASMVAEARAAAAAAEADADAPTVATDATALTAPTAVTAASTEAMSESEIEPLVDERAVRARAPRPVPSSSWSKALSTALWAHRHPRSFGARLYSFYRLLLHSALLGFLVCKSAAPLKELFTPGAAPRMRSVWIKSARALSSPFPLPPHPPLLPFPLRPHRFTPGSPPPLGQPPGSTTTTIGSSSTPKGSSASSTAIGSTLPSSTRTIHYRPTVARAPAAAAAALAATTREGPLARVPTVSASRAVPRGAIAARVRSCSSSAPGAAAGVNRPHGRRERSRR